MEQKPLIKVVVIGPESTGKSTLCELLATHYNTLWCPEYAREYLLKHGMNYSYDDLLYVAKQQLALEDKYIQSTVGSGQSAVNESLITTHWPRSGRNDHSPLLFIDTDMYVMKVWCEFVFDKCHKWILEQIVKRSYDLYLLCNIDLPWIQDELREYPDEAPRKKLFQIYKDIMINQSTPWIQISGSTDERLQTAIKAVDELVAG
ncbi:MAG TPA: ATP-binding protein [Chitinophagaceae bacterium]|nr:ATP-binding protein [Chitinophagaceae bacterium]